MIPFIRVTLYSEFMVIGGFSTTVIPYAKISAVSWNRSFLSLGGVSINLHGLDSSYILYPRDPKTFVILVDSHLAQQPIAAHT